MGPGPTITSGGLDGTAATGSEILRQAPLQRESIFILSACH